MSGKRESLRQDAANSGVEFQFVTLDREAKIEYAKDIFAVNTRNRYWTLNGRAKLDLYQHAFKALARR